MLKGNDRLSSAVASMWLIGTVLALVSMLFCRCATESADLDKGQLSEIYALDNERIYRDARRAFVMAKIAQLAGGALAGGDCAVKAARVAFDTAERLWDEGLRRGYIPDPNQTSERPAPTPVPGPGRL